MKQSPKRKPPKRVLSISGPLENDVISQAELAEVSSLQAAEWMAAQSAHKAVLRVFNRIRQGATIEPGDLTFDPELRMVRRRQAG